MSFRTPSRLLLIFIIWSAAAALLAGCGALLDPPRLATGTAQAPLVRATPEPVYLSAPTPTAVPADAAPTPDNRPTLAPNTANDTITLWVNETSPAHEAVMLAMINDFSAEQNINVELRLIAPNLLPQLVETAVISDEFDLPDILFHPLEYTVGWAERGVLSPDAAETALAQLDRETFDPAALELVSADGRIPALPVHGHQQLIIYRSDWFDDLNLAPPDTYEAMFAAAEATTDRENLVSGFVIPTESNLVTAHQGFEQLAAGNGCRLIDEAGEVLLLEDPCREAINFYYDIVHNFSPIGVQTDTSTRNAYLAGRTGLIVYSPAILPQLAGLDPDAPPICPDCDAAPDFLAQNSGILTRITGSGPDAMPANFGNITYLGVTSDANEEAAVAFADYFFNEGYESWLSLESERKVPMRWGTEGDGRRFIDAWGTTPLLNTDQTLTDLFGPDTVALLRRDIAPSDRWGFREGQGDLVSQLYQELTFSVVLQEMLSGYFPPGKTILEAYIRVIDLIPNYSYDLDLEAIEAELEGVPLDDPAE